MSTRKVVTRYFINVAGRALYFSATVFASFTRMPTKDIATVIRNMDDFKELNLEPKAKLGASMRAAKELRVKYDIPPPDKVEHQSVKKKVPEDLKKAYQSYKIAVGKLKAKY